MLDFSCHDDWCEHPWHTQPQPSAPAPAECKWCEETKEWHGMGAGKMHHEFESAAPEAGRAEDEDRHVACRKFIAWQKKQIDDAAHENAALRRDSEMLRHDGIVEIAVVNQSVSDYIEHWEGRTMKAEAEVDALRRERDDAREEIAWLRQRIDELEKK
jgi:hypothetical protein